MEPIDFKDSVSKLPVNERLQQQRQQQPIINQGINIAHHNSEVEARIDTTQHSNAAENLKVEREKRDREFNKRKKKEAEDNKNEIKKNKGNKGFFDITV